MEIQFHCFIEYILIRKIILGENKILFDSMQVLHHSKTNLINGNSKNLVQIFFFQNFIELKRIIWNECRKIGYAAYDFQEFVLHVEWIVWLLLFSRVFVELSYQIHLKLTVECGHSTINVFLMPKPEWFVCCLFNKFSKLN